MRIGPVKYSKDEDRDLLASFFLGLPVGLPAGLLLFYLLGFPLLPGHIPNDFAGRFVLFFLWSGKLEIVWSLITVILAAVFYKKKGIFNSWRALARILWAVFVFFPLMIAYVSLFANGIIFPVLVVTPWIDLTGHFWLSLLLGLPFLALFEAIFLSETSVRRVVRSIWFTRQTRSSPWKLKKDSAILTIVVCSWLVVLFSPLPNNLLVSLLLAAGSIVIVVYLERHRRKMRTNRRSMARTSRLDKDSSFEKFRE